MELIIFLALYIVVGWILLAVCLAIIAAKKLDR